MATMTRGKILWQRIKAQIGILKLWWTASGAYDSPPTPSSELAQFQEGEQIPLKGLVFVVGKVVHGPLPVLLLTPVERTNRAEKSAGARLRRIFRHEKERQRRDRERDIRRARKLGS